MTDVERIWHAKSNDELIQAAAELDTYTEAGQRIIRAELMVRGLEDPVAQAGEATAEPGVQTTEEDEDAAVRECVRCHVQLQYLGSREFHQGTHWGALGELGHLFESSEAFEVYVCPRCGHVDLYVPGVSGAGARREA